MNHPVLWVVATYVFGVLLHVDRLPWWSSAAVGAIAAWRVVATLRAAPMPSAWLRLGLGLALLLAVLAQFNSFTGLSAGTALLASMGAVKLLETRTRRDQFIVLGVGVFLLIAACLDRQSLLRVPLYAAHVWLACAAMAVIATPEAALGARRAFATSGRAIAYALPIALLLFLLFPRVQGQIWALPGSGAGVTGLANEMTPGAIQSLSESDEPAFRVRFIGARPPLQSLYWRGPVLHEFDGYTWRRRQGQLARRTELTYLGAAYRYRITLEPHEQNWWFALDLPTGPPQAGVFMTFDYQLVSIQPVSRPTAYELTSHVSYRSTEPLSLLGRRIDLQLPEGRNPRSLRLAQELRSQHPEPRALIAAVLELFRSGGFSYTLTPPKLDLNSVDDFLFNTRRGFCGHFASAFVTLMRAAGVPARVVTGYHGGEWNPIGGYYIVRQSDAHAWAETWIDGEGWVRVDPTGVVAPERLTRGFFEGLAGQTINAIGGLRNLTLLSRISLSWDAANTWWKDRIIEFDLRSQFQLLSKLGISEPSVRVLALLLAAALMLWLLWVGIAFGLQRPRRPRDPLARAYRELCGKLARVTPREPHEGPRSYAQRLASCSPAAAERAVALLDRYAELRYGPPQAAENTASFAATVRRLRLARPPR